MEGTSQNVIKIAALCGMIWFACIIDACYTWFLPWMIRYLISAPLVIYSTILLKKEDRLVISKQRRIIFILLLVLILFLIVTKARLFEAPLCYGPLACVILWDEQTLLKFYTYFKKFVILYAVISIFVEILVLTDSWHYLPYVDLPPQDTVQENLDVTNHVFGLFVIPQYGFDVGAFYRAMGPLREGGHFSIFIGFVYFVEKCVYDKRNILLIVAGLLTLSPNFVFYFLLAEGYVAIKKKRIIKSLVQSVCFVALIAAILLYSPDFIQDAIVKIVLERSLQENVENMGSNGFMALIEGRTDMGGEQMYSNFVNRAGLVSKMVGMSYTKVDFVLSDFRTLICHYGYLGFTLFVGITYAVACLSRNKFYGMLAFLLGAYVMISRAWMFDQSYIWMMMFFASIVFCYESNRRMGDENEVSKSVVEIK